CRTESILTVVRQASHEPPPQRPLYSERLSPTSLRQGETSTPRRTKSQLSSATFLFSRIFVLQDRAMCVSFAQLFVATAQRRLQFALQLSQVFQFLPHVSK